MSDHELISDTRTSVLSDLFASFRESPPAIYGRNSHSIDLIEQRIGGSAGSSLDDNTIVPHDRLLPMTTKPRSDWKEGVDGWEYCGPLAVIGKIPNLDGYHRPNAPIKTDWKEGEDGWEYCGPLAVIRKIPYPEGYRPATAPIKISHEDWWVDGVERPGTAQILPWIQGERPGTAQILPWIQGERPGTAQVLPWIQGERPGTAQVLPWIQDERPGTARILPWIQGGTPGSTRILPWIQGETPGSARILPWIQRESPGSGILPGRLPSAPGRIELLPWHEKPRAPWPLRIDPKISEWLDLQASLLSSTEKPE